MQFGIVVKSFIAASKELECVDAPTGQLHGEISAVLRNVPLSSRRN
jgi:hypothetical protein